MASSVIRSVFIEHGLDDMSTELLNRIYNCALIAVEKLDHADDIPSILYDLIFHGKTVSSWLLKIQKFLTFIAGN